MALEAAVAPHIAAQESGKTLSASRLVGFCRGVAILPVELALIEGAGGWRVPLNDRETLADVARELSCPVVIVVGMRPGLFKPCAAYRRGSSPRWLRDCRLGGEYN